MTLLGGAAGAWPLAARAQQPAMPVIGFLSAQGLAQTTKHVAAFRRGLGETGYVDGQNVAIGINDGRYDRLPALAAELVRRYPLSPDAAPEIRDVQAAAHANGLQLRMFNASTPDGVDAALVSVAQQRPDALIVGTDPFFVVRREEIVAEIARVGIAAIYPFREFTEVGGLISYGANIANTYRQAGIYGDRMLEGTKPADLPVVQPTTFELVINLKTAKALGFDVPATLYARSDEVIE
jgi:putative ABC transport system substrate-binding protein